MNTKKTFAIVLAVLLVFVMLLSHLFVIMEADHDCAGEECHICAVIAICQNTLKALGDALVAAAIVFACFCFTAPILTFYRATKYNETPISLKVKLLN